MLWHAQQSVVASSSTSCEASVKFQAELLAAVLKNTILLLNHNCSLSCLHTRRLKWKTDHIWTKRLSIDCVLLDECDLSNAATSSLRSTYWTITNKLVVESVLHCCEQWRWQSSAVTHTTTITDPSFAWLKTQSITSRQFRVHHTRVHAAKSTYMNTSRIIRHENQ